MAGGRKKPPAPEGAPGDDMDLWRHVAGQTRPLKGRKPTLPPVEPPAAEPGKPDPKTPKKPRQRIARSPAAPTPRKAPELAPGAGADVDRRTAERLKRGKLPIESRLDLHGHRQDEAFRELSAFLAGSQAAGRRCVLVISGEGEGREGGVLRQSLPKWLNEPKNRTRIVAFAPAQPQHGGHGAVYVLLKRKRD